MKTIDKIIQEALEACRNESYYHKKAKDVLIEWIKEKPKLFWPTEILSVREEEQCCADRVVLFVPDISIYSSDGLIAIYEIDHTHKVESYKLERMMDYFFLHNICPEVHEINSHWILKQTMTPTTLNTNKLI